MTGFNEAAVDEFDEQVPDNEPTPLPEDEQPPPPRTAADLDEQREAEGD